MCKRGNSTGRRRFLLPNPRSTITNGCDSDFNPLLWLSGTSMLPKENFRGALAIVVMFSQAIFSKACFSTIAVLHRHIWRTLLGSITRRPFTQSVFAGICYQQMVSSPEEFRRGQYGRLLTSREKTVCWFRTQLYGAM